MNILPKGLTLFPFFSAPEPGNPPLVHAEKFFFCAGTGRTDARLFEDTAGKYP